MEKYYHSTRNKKVQALPKEAVLAGLASDGGLFVLDDLDQISLPLADMMKMDYAQLARCVMGVLLFDYSEAELDECIRLAYQGQFDDEAITPLVHSGKDHILELFHGPTSAFKDVGLRMLPQLMSVALKKEKDARVMILTATSGDTGKAAMAGFQDVDRVGITVFYPDHGVSEIQRLQMVTQQGENTFAVAMKGNFDDAQSGVKQIFHDVDYQSGFKTKGIQFSSANSINIGRLAPQVVYYFDAYRQMVQCNQIRYGDVIDFCVPTGNFGNVLAGYYAKLMGLPIRKLIVATNANHVLYDFLTTGVYDRNRPFYKTISPSMDILISSNLERLLYDVSGCDTAYVQSLMADLQTKGRYCVSQAILAKIQETFAVGYASDDQCRAVMKAKYEADQYVLDPHSACAYVAMRECADENIPCVLLATASPYKFCGSVSEALFGEQESDEFAMMDALETRTHIQAPKLLKQLRSMPIRHQDVIERSEMKSIISQKVGVLWQ